MWVFIYTTRQHQWQWQRGLCWILLVSYAPSISSITGKPIQYFDARNAADADDWCVQNLTFCLCVYQAVYQFNQFYSQMNLIFRLRRVHWLENQYFLPWTENRRILWKEYVLLESDTTGANLRCDLFWPFGSLRRSTSHRKSMTNDPSERSE